MYCVINAFHNLRHELLCVKLAKRIGEFAARTVVGLQCFRARAVVGKRHNVRLALLLEMRPPFLQCQASKPGLSIVSYLLLSVMSFVQPRAILLSFLCEIIEG